MKGKIEMYKRILVPLDGSELAEIALPLTQELAEKLDSEIILLNVRAPGEDPENPEHRVYLSKMAETLEQKIRKSGDIPPGQKMKVESHIIGSTGLLTHTAEEIVDFAEKENVSLIIMATHGRTGVRRWALGSTAEKVVRVAQCPVFLVRANLDAPDKIQLSKILVPLDGSKQSETVLTRIQNLAPKMQAQVTLLHVVVPPYHVYPLAEMPGYYGVAGMVRVPYSEDEIKPLIESAEEYLQKVSDKLTNEGVKTSYRVKVGPAAEEIITATDELGADMVAMSTHGESGFSRWEHGSIADKVLHAGNTPLLLVRENNL